MFERFDRNNAIEAFASHFVERHAFKANLLFDTDSQGIAPCNSQLFITQAYAEHPAVE